MKTFVIHPNDDGKRLDKVLRGLLPNAPQSLLYKYIRTNKIKLCGKRAKPEMLVAAGDELRYFGDEALLAQGTATVADACYPHILYEDAQIILLHKPPQTACQPDAVHQTGTLVQQLLRYLTDTGAYDPKAAQAFTPALCNRLDFNTSGIVIGAKTGAALRMMNEKIRLRQVHKFYRCTVQGIPNPPEGVVRSRLVKDGAKNISRIAENGGKYAETKYRTISVDGHIATLEIELLTGRSHQIRVHMQSIGCPLVGDPKYGNGGKGQDLCAYRVSFDFIGESGVLAYLDGKTFSICE